MRFYLPVLLLIALNVDAQSARPRPAPKNAPARLRQMDPKQRQRLLESLPPDRRKQAAERLDKFDSLPPDERRQLEQRWQRFQQLSPEGRERARKIFQDFNELTEERRAVLAAEFTALRDMPHRDRDVKIADPEYRKRFSKRELRILEQYCELSSEVN